MHTFAIIDKQPILRTGLRLFLKKYFKDSTILPAENIQSFTPLYTEHKPDLFILGMGIGPKTDSFDSIKIVKKQFPNAVILVYDQKSDATLLPIYLKAGVSGYLSKESDLEELNECINLILAGKQYICRHITEMNLNIAYKIKNPDILSYREYEVASYLSQGMKITWIAHTLGIAISTSSTFKNKIFRKLKVDNVLQLREAMFLEYSL